MENCNHSKESLMVTKTMDKATTSPGHLEILTCTACSTDLIKAKVHVNKNKREILSIGDQIWYTTEVAYKYPEDAAKDGVPVNTYDT